MTLRFAYRLIQVPRPPVPLRGRWVRPRPIVTVSVIGATGVMIEDALVDSGADDSVFPDSVASLIGIDLSVAPRGAAAGIGMNPVPLRYAQATLRLTDSREHREWQTWIGFTSVPMRRSILGFAGFLQFFTAVFDGEREQLELAVNTLYPGI